MTTVEFGTKASADAIREEYNDHLCPDDDKRLKTVRFRSDTPENVLEQVRRNAAQGRAERESGPGQAPLTDAETERIDFTETTYPHAASVKAIAADAGVDDWLAYYDPTLTVDEHREVMAQAAQEGGGRRMDSEASATEKAGEAAATAEAEQCDHARGHCEHGNVDACEFLTQTCGYDDEEVDRLLAGDADGEEITGADAGALQRAWGGYNGAVANIRAALDRLREEHQHAERAAEAINAVRAKHGQDPMEYEELREAHAEIVDVAEQIGATCDPGNPDCGPEEHSQPTSGPEPTEA